MQQPGLAAASKSRGLLSCVAFSSGLLRAGKLDMHPVVASRAGVCVCAPGADLEQCVSSRQKEALSGAASCSSGPDRRSPRRWSFTARPAAVRAPATRWPDSKLWTTTAGASRCLATRAAAARDGGLACPGCGVYMQDKDPKAPGYFQRPAALDRAAEEDDDGDDAQMLVENAVAAEEEGEEEEFVIDDDEGLGKGLRKSPEQRMTWSGINWEDWAVQEKEQEMADRMVRPFGDMEWNEVGSNTQAAKDAWTKLFSEQGQERDREQVVVVCARCHSLRHYAQVKDEEVENLLPDFDFDRLIGARLKKAYGRRAVVLMVVDAADFDGSFPRTAASLLAEVERESGDAWKDGMPGNTPRLILVLTKIDLLPKQVSPNRVEQWVRRRARAGGAPRVSGVHLVSAYKGWGIPQLALHVKDLAGSRGDVWVIGSQNAGKSSLINAFGKLSGGKRAPQLTEAPVLGTTVGVLKLDGILPAKAHLYDTPGLIHPHQLTTRLNRDELKVVQVRKELRPRTYRVKVGSSVHIGALVRLDVMESSADSFYLSVFASAYIPLHMGKTESAEELLEKHVGGRLTPPMDGERLAEIGHWVARSVKVAGDQWDHNSVDIAVAGLGWISFGIKGDAVIKVWTFEGVAITTRESLIFDKALDFERAGFTVPVAAPKPDKAKPKPKPVKNGKDGSEQQNQPVKQREQVAVL